MSQAASSAAELDRVVAVDWSGDRSAAGQRKKIWGGVWTADGGRVDGGRASLWIALGGDVGC